MKRNSGQRGFTLLQLVVGMSLTVLSVVAALACIVQYMRASADTASRVDADGQMDELVRLVEHLWAGRSQDALTNCNCPGKGGPDENCPAIVGGPCVSHHVIEAASADCKGLRIFRPVVLQDDGLGGKVAIPEFQDFRTICHASAMPGLEGQAPAPFPECDAGNRPLIQRRRDINGAASPSIQYPSVAATEVVAGSMCVTPIGTDYVVMLQMLVRLSKRQTIIQRKLILSPNDKSSNIDYMENIPYVEIKGN